MKPAASSLLIVLLGCSGNGADPSPRSDKPATASPSPSATPVQAAPRWETISTFSGTGPIRTAEFQVLKDAIQWRVRWSCTSGDLTIQSVPPPRSGKTLLDKQPCPKDGEAYSIRTGRASLQIEAGGDWKAIVDQQVSTPTDEPEPAGATVEKQSSFYPLEKSGEGTAKFLRLGDGKLVLRFENFKVTNNVDLFVWLSEAKHPNNSAEAIAEEKVVLGNLKSTTGNQNYEIPTDVPTESIRSIVIWCEPIAIAYSAAAF